MWKAQLRVHIVPVGFQVERVTEPVIRMKGDRVYLISYKKDDMASNHIKRIKRIFAAKKIEVREEYTDIWDLISCMKMFREILNRERENQIFFNVSTGSTLAGIAAMLTCMIYKKNPYYVKLDYSSRSQNPQSKSETVEDVLPIPVYKIHAPEDRHLRLLSIVKDKQKGIRKKDLIAELKELKIIKPVMGTKLSVHAEHTQLNTIIRPLVRDKYLEIESRPRNSLVRITEQGINALEIFGDGIPLKETETITKGKIEI